MPLAPAAIRLSIGGHLAFVVAVILAGEAAQLDAKLLGLGVGAFLHLGEERVGHILCDQTNNDRAVGRRRAYADGA